MKTAIKMFLAYVKAMLIDFFAVPVEKSDGLYIAIVTPAALADAFNSRLVYRRKGEKFARLRRCYSAINILPILRPVAQVKTQYRRLADIPPHKDSIARGFEKVVAEYLNGEHTGDNISSVDVIAPVYGRIECKTGEGALFHAGKD